MSAPLNKTDILFKQRLLAVAGLYTGDLDGLWGKQSEAADAAWLAAFDKFAANYGKFDTQTERNIMTLLPAAQQKARQFLIIARRLPNATVKILSGTRTYAEQTALYSQGRGTKGKIVTNAKAGQSLHNFGVAWDVGIFVEGVYYTGRNAKEDRAYKDLAALVKANLPGLEWGGDW